MTKLFSAVITCVILLSAIVFAEGLRAEDAQTEKASQPVAAGTVDVIEEEEYEVYVSVFSSGKLDGIPDDYVVLEKETIKEQINKESWKNIDSAMIDDFNSRNDMRYQLEDKFPSSGHARLNIQVREQKDMRMSPFDTGRTYVSRAGFNKDRTEALVYVQHVATPESGIGHYVFLHKGSGKWTISGSSVGKIF
ncbi:MAG: hypothetical protein C4538_07575 [Nitrospiraceae bacterium]|nr:MAG: hypothetical protein C4538_07575 [Nitrospiraceae bacterium]